MFGHDDDKKDEDKHEDALVAPTDNANDGGWQHPGPPPADEDVSDDSPQRDNFGSDHQSNEPDAAQEPVDDHLETAPAHTPPVSDDAVTADPDIHNDDLIDLKQEALGKLSPLIGHLDQSPEEKFRTLMMMIQASDDQALIRQAYDSALQIDDEKTRAQALLDIVNEINYFTQNPKSE